MWRSGRAPSHTGRGENTSNPPLPLLDARQPLVTSEVVLTDTDSEAERRRLQYRCWDDGGNVGGGRASLNLPHPAPSPLVERIDGAPSPHEGDRLRSELGALHPVMPHAHLGSWPV